MSIWGSAPCSTEPRQCPEGVLALLLLPEHSSEKPLLLFSELLPVAAAKCSVQCRQMGKETHGKCTIKTPKKAWQPVCKGKFNRKIQFSQNKHRQFTLDPEGEFGFLLTGTEDASVIFLTF